MTKADLSKPNAAGSQCEHREAGGLFIQDVRSIEDLAEGETVTPEPEMGYELRTIDGSRFEAGTVECLIRRGPAIYARTTAGEEFAVTGVGGHVLAPLSF